MTEKSADLSLRGEEIHAHCIAHCNKCLVDTLVEQQRSKCQVCSTLLVYLCKMCKKQFINPAAVTNHVIKQLEQDSTLSKCSKCYRSNFSTRCNLVEHERNCNTPFHFDRDIVVNHPSEIFEDVKPPISLLPVETNQNNCADSIDTDNNIPYAYDDLEIGEDFKPHLTITHSTSAYCPEQTDLKPLKSWSPSLQENDNQFLDISKDGSRKKRSMTLSVHQNENQSLLLALNNQSKRFNRFTCDHCNFKTNHKGSLTRHIQAKHLPRDYNANKCSRCKKSFSYRFNLFKHLKICGQSEDHIRSLMLSCDDCNYKSIHKQYLARHIQTKHLPRDQKAFKCIKCKKCFSQRSTLSTHSKICGQSRDQIHFFGRLTCDHCSYKTNNKSTLTSHIQAKHLPRDPNANKCNKCKKSFSFRSTLLIHSKICGQPKDHIRPMNRFSCDHCNYKTNIKTHLARHIQSKHLPRDLNANKCNKCNKTFCERSRLQRHLEVCGQSKDFVFSLKHYSCDNCCYKTTRKGNLTIHIQTKHLPRDLEANKCDKCKKCFSCQSNLLTHSKVCGQSEDVIRSLMRFTCDYCNYKSKYKSHIAIHIQAKHLLRDPNANKCVKCKKCFSCRSYLLTHSKTCGQPKDYIRPSNCYVCDHCNYKSTQKSSLTVHIKAKHLPRDPNVNKCNKCKKNFSRAFWLRRHLQICGQSAEFVNSLKRFICDHCNYKTHIKGNLLTHVKLKHLPRESNANKCKKCNKSFSLRSNLRSHLKICG